MTRANIYILTKQGKFKFQSNSSAYPSNVMESLIKFATSTASTNSFFDKAENIDEKTIGFYDSPDSRELAEFIEALGLTLGEVGNFSYVYEIDFVKQTLKAWDSTLYWVNAPLDWKARGWNCWEGNNGKFGYSNWKKRKLIYNKKLSELVVSVEDFVITVNKGEVELAEKIG